MAPELAEVAPWLDSFLVLRDQILSRVDAVDVRIASALLSGEKPRDVVERG